jgi:hypothetical protein
MVFTMENKGMDRRFKTLEDTWEKMGGRIRGK